MSLSSKSFAKNLIIFFVLLIGGVLLIIQLLKLYTHHGRQVQVPDLKEQTFSEAKKGLKKQNLRFFVQDTSSYNAALPPYAVINQSPQAGSYVKRKRTIYLSLNAALPPQVKIPDFVHNTTTLKQAELKLKQLGLEVGAMTYKPDIAKNVVLEQWFDGKPIQPGTMVRKGDKIDFVLGDGLGGATVAIPDLVGLSYQEALTVLKSIRLLPGKIVFDNQVAARDSTIVYYQHPEPSHGVSLLRGDSIDIYLTLLTDSN